MLYVYKILHFIVSRFESLIWHIKRKILISELAHCGKNVWIGRNWRITPKNVHIGDDVSLGYGVTMQAMISKIILGNQIMFGPNVSIHGGNHRVDLLGRYMKSITIDEKRPEIDDADVVIENDVWVGDGATILKGVRIGKGSVIGAGVVVYKDVPPYSIVTGAEMKIRRRFTTEQKIEHEKILCQKEKQ